MYCTGGPCLWISSPVSVTIDSSTSIPYWAPLGESLERRVEELEERTIWEWGAIAATMQAIGVHVKWIALKKTARLASEVVAAAAVRVPTPCTPR